MPSLTQLEMSGEVDGVLASKDGTFEPVRAGQPEPPDALHLRYRPRYYSRAFEQERAAVRAEQGFAAGAIYDVLAIVAAWDLADAGGTVYPLTEAGIAPISTRILNEIVAGVIKDMTPGEARSTS